MPGSMHVNMLGEFTLQVEGASSVIRANLTGRSRRLWILIAYLIVNRDRGVTPEELIDLLWSDAAGDNPMATLQNNVSRARAIFQKEGLEDARDLFKFENGLYYWAPQRTTEVDIDDFETLASQLQNGVKPEDLEAARKACDLYKGDFLAQAIEEAWCVKLRTYYQALFLRVCNLTVQTLIEEERFAEAEALCERAIEISPSTEAFSVLLMHVLVLDGRPQQALDHYDRIRDLFASEYHVDVSSELEFERAAASQALNGRDLSGTSIRTFLQEDEHEHGAFRCSNAVFRAIVQMHVREMKRSGANAQLLAIGFDQTETISSNQATHMKRLEETLLVALRTGDPFTKMNALQFLALLPGATRENGDIVAQRIVDRFRGDYPQMRSEFHVFLFDLAAFVDEIPNS